MCKTARSQTLTVRQLLHRMMYYCLAVLLTLQCTLGRAVEPDSNPNRRHSRQVSLESQRIMGMQVTPSEATVPKADYVTVTCTVDAGYSPGHHPIIYFYRRLSHNMVMHVDSSFPGMVLGVPHTRRLTDDLRRTTRTLSFLGKESYASMEKGANSFYCKAILLNGAVSRRDFLIFTEE